MTSRRGFSKRAAKQLLGALLGLGSIAVFGPGCSGEETSGPRPEAAPAAIAVVSGDNQVGEVGTPLPHPIIARVTDASARPTPGVSVTFEVKGGGGRLTATTVTTDGQGLASVSWTMGYVLNVERPMVTARVAGQNLDPATFSAVATLTAGTVSVATGNDQVGLIRGELPQLLSVRVTTPGAAGMPVRGVPVLWTVTAGGGTALATSTTDATGMAYSRWTLGDTSGNDSQALHAAVASLGGASVEFVASAISPPTSIRKIAGDSQVGTAGQPLGQPLVVEVRNAAGEPVAGISVHWAAYDNCDGWCGPGGAGSVSAPTTVTDSAGRASTLGVLPESATWENAGFYDLAFGAWFEGSAPAAHFLAHVSPGPPVRMGVWDGDGQSALAGSQLPRVLTVYVRDEFSNAVPGVTVQWAVASGSGSTEVASSTTDASGLASNRWTIGTTVGTNNQMATATVRGLAGSPVTFTASATAGP